MLSLNEYLKKEDALEELNRIMILGDIPLWRIVRQSFRVSFIEATKKTVDRRYSVIKQIANYFVSAIAFVKTIFVRRPYDTLIFPHSRLFKNLEGVYMERFSDSLIDCSNYKDDYLIVERHQNGVHHKPRLHQQNLIYSDFIDVSSIVLKYFIYPFAAIIYKKELAQLYNCLDAEFCIPQSYKKSFGLQLSSFIISYYLTKVLIDSCSPKRVYLATRETFKHVVSICKHKGVRVYELQHGIIYGENILYCGQYSEAIDPDCFLTFGQSVDNKLVGMPEEKIKAIGFPYKQYLLDRVSPDNLNRKTILVVSEPQISSMIVDTLLDLSERYKEYTFHIRCHPQEKINEKDLARIVNHPIQIVDNSEESFIAISKYDYVIGENSSCLYEAAFLGKKIGRLNFNGLASVLTGDFNVGVLIDSVDDFQEYLSCGGVDVGECVFYSDFDVENLKDL